MRHDWHELGSHCCCSCCRCGRVTDGGGDLATHLGFDGGNHIFDVMGPISGVGHCKDLIVDSGLTLHLVEKMPGRGQLDLVTALQRWEGQYPDGYMLLEHLADEEYAEAAANTHAILAEARISVH